MLLELELDLAYIFHSWATTGVVPACKAAVSEVSDDSNQAFGIAVLGTAVGTGNILGPAVSGAIADPVGQYNLTISSKQVLLHDCLDKYHGV